MNRLSLSRKIFVSVILFFFALIPLLSASASPISLPEGGLLFSGLMNGTWDIYCWMDVDGDDVIINLTRSPLAEGNPIFWKYKNVILAAVEETSGRYAIAAFDLHGKEIWRTTDPSGSLGWPKPSPWDDRILVVREEADGSVQPGIIRYPDGVFEPFSPADANGGQMAWLSPDRILISRQTPKGFDLYERIFSEGVEKAVVQGGVNWQAVTPLMGGLPVFFSRRVGQVSNIFRLSLGGVAKWKYLNETNGRTYDWQPSVTPNGEGLIYQSLRGGRFATIYRDLETGNERVIDLSSFSTVYHPTWIPLQAVNEMLAGAK